jgi:hypothetical protein
MGKNLLSSPFLLPIVRGNRSKCTVFGVKGKLFLPLNLIETNWNIIAGGTNEV